MTADGAIYQSQRLAAAYAFSRPPVHRHVAERISQYLPEGRVDRALDIGCGAGVSTAALAPLARKAVGLEPYAPMLEYASAVAPGAAFARGRAEALPFGSAAFDLVTAGGALNYADVDQSLAEVARVLAPHGLFVPYDFSAGRRLRDDTRLSAWYSEFRARFPSSAGYALNLNALGYEEHDLDCARYEAVDIGIAMSAAAYLDYLLGDSGVEAAIARGEREADIRRSCEDAVNEVFCGRPRDVIFEAQIAYVRRAI